MKTIRNLEVPTGNILIVEGDKGLLEMVSLGDYGKEVNVKADFMGLSRPINHVNHVEMLPLEKKWVITISTQYGCSMDCTFCDVPLVGKGINASLYDLIEQVETGIALHPEVTYTERLNIHYARMGEPTWNPDVLLATYYLKEKFNKTHRIHPVISTMMPKNNVALKTFIDEWMLIKNELLNGEAGLQLSINSTCEEERNKMFSGNALTLKEISELMKDVVPKGRKITLNFAVAGYEINANILAKYFDPDYYLVKLTPMHKTNTANKNDIKTEGDYTSFYPYEKHEKDLKEVGFDVLVFIASEYEDLGRITCGNAILSGTLPLVPYREI